MKKFIIFSLLLAISAAIFGQSKPVDQPVVKIDYLKKSKEQKTAAQILLGGGLGLTIAGAAIGAYEVVFDLIDGFSTGESQTNTGAIIFIAGGVAMIGSIPLFVSAAKNKGRYISASAGLKIEKTSMIKQQSFTLSSYPAISLKVNW